MLYTVVITTSEVIMERSDKNVYSQVDKIHFHSLSQNIQKVGSDGSEVWNGVYMIVAPVKKFGGVRLSTNFPSKQLWRRMQTWKDDEFLPCFMFPGVQT